MQLVDLTIIYVALGAPVGLYYAASHWSEGPMPATLLGVCNAMLWPAAFVISKLHSRSDRRVQDTLERRISASAQKRLPPGDMTGFNLVIERYAALSEAAAFPVGTSYVKDLTEIASSQAPPELMRIAVRRRNEAKIRVAHAAAAADFVLQASLSDRSDRDLYIRLAEQVGDHKTAEQISCLPSMDSQNDLAPAAA